tara:strand:- start:85240 stop:85467 length:228 start_codon:yes stop_codon:yes gene_type:complete
MKTDSDYSKEDEALARELPSHCEQGSSYGISHIQRHLRVGYNRANYVLESALAQAVVVKDSERDWLFCLPKTKSQ